MQPSPLHDEVSGIQELRIRRQRHSINGPAVFAVGMIAGFAIACAGVAIGVAVIFHFAK